MGRLAFPIGSRIYVDTSPIIYTGEENEIYQPVLREFWSAARENETQLVTSELTLLEVLVVPLREGDSELVEHYEELLKSSVLRLVSISLDVLRCGSELRARQNFKTPDAIHAATAMLSGCSHLITNDPTFRRLEAIEVIVLSDHI